MKILVTGAKGQLGSDLVKELQKRNIEAVGVDLQEMDIRSESSCREVIETEQARAPLEAVIHCAAYTAVDKAEDEPELVREVNARGTENIGICRSPSPAIRPPDARAYGPPELRRPGHK